MISLYCNTNGFSNYLLSSLIPKGNSLESFLHSLENNSSLLSWKDNTSTILHTLKKEGYAVLSTKIPKNICEQLKSFAESSPCLPSGDGQNDKSLKIYNPKEPKAPTYKFREEDLVENELIQKLAADANLLKVVTLYLNRLPILDLIAMWWSTAFQREADHNSAQLYHFDMDRLRWLKVFFYLTDVDSETGAHCYIARSHRPGQKPREIRKRGYSRIPDSDLKRYYPLENFKEITGEAGTIIIGDTMAYHKGKPLAKGQRLILEFEYANSLFGAPTQRIEIKKPTHEFSTLKANHQNFFNKFYF